MDYILKEDRWHYQNCCCLLLLLGVAIAGVFLRASEKIKNTGELFSLAALASVSDIKYIELKASVNLSPLDALFPNANYFKKKLHGTCFTETISSIWNMQKGLPVKIFQGNSVLQGNIFPTGIKLHNIVALLLH